MQTQHFDLSLEKGEVLLPTRTNREHHSHHPTGEWGDTKKPRDQEPKQYHREGEGIQWGTEEGRGGFRPCIIYAQVGIELTLPRRGGGGGRSRSRSRCRSRRRSSRSSGGGEEKQSVEMVSVS